MADMTLEEAPQNVRDLFNKGLAAFERKNLDYAIDMFMSCLDMEPKLLEVRKYLRAAQIARFKSKRSSKIGRKIGSATGSAAVAKMALKTKTGKPLDALKIGEGLFAADPLNPWFMRVYSKAAIAAELPELAVQTLEIARDHHPEDMEVMQALGAAYMEVGKVTDARECFEAVLEVTQNSELRRQLKDAMALESITKDGWEENQEEGGYREKLKDSDEAASLEREQKVVRSQDDTAAMIEETKAKIEKDPSNINYYRALANLHASVKQFDEAIAVLAQAEAAKGGTDPEIDATRSVITLKRYDYEVAQLTEAGDEEAATAKQQERDTYHFDNIKERVAKYPNDLYLHYEMGIAMFERDMLNEAIHEFQLSQQHLKWKVNSLCYLGFCFKAKGQNDMAIEQLEAAIGHLQLMDATKKDVMYELGGLYEAVDDTEKAAATYKEIYRADINYKDVAQKVEEVYSGGEEPPADAS